MARSREKEEATKRAKDMVELKVGGAAQPIEGGFTYRRQPERRQAGRKGGAR